MPLIICKNDEALRKTGVLACQVIFRYLIEYTVNDYRHFYLLKGKFMVNCGMYIKFLPIQLVWTIAFSKVIIGIGISFRPKTSTDIG